MIYNNIKPAKFLFRPNRFIAEIEIEGKHEIAHVKNTGRCKELLIAGADIFVQEFDTALRKTKYDLISVYKGDRLINMDSQVPNKAFAEYAAQGRFLSNLSCIKGEVTYKSSRFDFYAETDSHKIFIEVKGVTLEKDNICMFPDAPTQRGIKHITELIDAAKNGYDAYIVFVVQMDNVTHFTPNYETHKEFGQMLKSAKANNVKLLAITSTITADSIVLKNEIPIIL